MEVLEAVRQFVNLRLFTIGGQDVTLSTLLVCFLIFILSLFVSALVQRLLTVHLFQRLRIGSGPAYAIRRFTHYTIVALGLLVALTTANINLNAIAIVLGFLSVGIGFGLQNITSNFISGLILLFERPVSVGDLIEVGGHLGRVSEIRMRATLVNTLDNVTIIVPNSSLIENEVVNWSHGDAKVRLHVPVGIAYGSDMEKVRDAMLRAARGNGGVLAAPAPEVRFLEFGDSSLNVDLLVWVADPGDLPRIHSELNFAIDAAFRQAGIVIPFPQRDLNLQLTPAVETLAGRKA
jgi:small-conductance mechanosensitive channel